MKDLKLENMAVAYRKLRPFLRMLPGRYDDERGFVPDAPAVWCLDEDNVRAFNRNHIRQTNAPRKYLIWAPSREDLKHPTFEEYLEAYNA